MDCENGKRKATTSPGETDGLCNDKKRPNPFEAVSSTHSTQVTCNINGESSRGSDLTQKLVAMWVGGSDSHHPFMTQEVRKSMALRDAQEEATEAENVVHMLRNKLNNVEAVTNNLKQSLKAEETIKAELISKMDLTGDLATTIIEHINYITDTLQRFQQHKDRLSDMYTTMILKQREDCNMLKNNEEDLQDRIKDLQNTVVALEKDLKKICIMQDDKSNEMLRAFEAELTKVRNECKNTLKQLDEVGKENKQIQSRLTDKESYSLKLEEKVTEYEDGLKNLNEQLIKSSTNLESIANEKLRLQKEFADKNVKILNISKDLESTRTNCTEQLVEISTMRVKNNDLEKNIKSAVDQRQSLEKSFEEASKRNMKLARDVEKLMIEKEEAVRELKNKIESAERERKRILSETNKEINELETEQERILKFHADKYESCLVEIKSLEARHQSELSRVSTWSNSPLLNVTTENRRLEDAIGALGREKNDLQIELQQIEDLLKKHTSSEKELRIKLDQCQDEATRYAAAVTTAQTEKKRIEDETQKNICKIQQLGKELLNLQFNRSAATSNEKPENGASGDTDRKTKKRVKKPAVSSRYKKSILKGDSRPRRTRSTPPSPVADLQPVAATFDRKITFNFDSSSEGSSINLPQSSNVTNFVDSSDLFDDLVATERSSSQPTESFQTLKSQRQPRKKKLFTFHASQSK